MPYRLTRLAPLTGAVFAVLTAVGFFTGSETPDANATPARVLVVYAAHRSEIETTSVLIAIAFLFAVFWAGTLRAYLRTTPGAEGVSSLVLAAGVLLAVGAATLAGIEYGLAHEINHLGPQTAQALNVLDNQLFLPLVMGGCVFGISAGLAILRGAGLPRWLGWAAIVIGIVAVIPPIGFFALLALLLWSLVTSILMYVRGAPPVESSPAFAA